VNTDYLPDEQGSQVARAELVTRAFFIVAAVLLAFVFGTMLWLLLALNGVADQNRSYGQRLVDCTTPGGQCYASSQKQQSGAVQVLNRVTIWAAWCAKTSSPDATIDQLKACIERGVASENK
jgi:hypothetical protein